MLEQRHLVRPLAVAALLLLLPGCPGSATGSGDGGTGDAGAVDAGTADAGHPDLCAGVDCSSLDDACNKGVCNPSDGTCAKQPVADGTTCDDGDACTTSDQCTGGTCAGTAVDCSSLTDACHTGVCDSATGACTATQLPDGTACDDGDACTTADACTGGTCAGTAVDCTGMTDQCNTGACDATTGACMATPVADGTSCLTGNVCSWHDACAAGACTSGFVGDCGPTGLVVPDKDLTWVAGGGGGSPFTDDCPLGQVPVGIQGYVSGGSYDRLLDHVAVICGTPSISGTTVTVGPGATVPATGGEGTWTANRPPFKALTCPANQVAVGYSGATGDAGGTTVSVITLQCAPLIVGGSNTTGFGIAVGAISQGPTLGMKATTPVPATICPLGMITRGITGASGDILNAFGMTCGKPDLQIVTASPQGGGNGGGGAAQDCPTGQVPIGFTGSVATAADFSGQLTKVTMQCGRVAVTSDGNGGWTTSITPGATLPSSGTWGGYGGTPPQTLTCPAGQALVGLAGAQGPGSGTATGTFVQQLTLRCAPLAFTGDPKQGFTVGYDSAAIGEQTLGYLPGAAFGAYDCPAGTVARGVAAHSGAIMDSIALRCSPVIPAVQ